MREIPNRLLLKILAAAIFCFSCSGPAHAQVDDTFGSWSLGSPAPDSKLATHSILLRNNKILVVSGSSYNCTYEWGKEDTRLYDIQLTPGAACLALLRRTEVISMLFAPLMSMITSVASSFREGSSAMSTTGKASAIQPAMTL